MAMLGGATAGYYISSIDRVVLDAQPRLRRDILGLAVVGATCMLPVALYEFWNGGSTNPYILLHLGFGAAWGGAMGWYMPVALMKAWGKRFTDANLKTTFQAVSPRQPGFAAAFWRTLIPRDEGTLAFDTPLPPRPPKPFAERYGGVRSQLETLDFGRKVFGRSGIFIFLVVAAIVSFDIVQTLALNPDTQSTTPQAGGIGSNPSGGALNPERQTPGTSGAASTPSSGGDSLNLSSPLKAPTPPITGRVTVPSGEVPNLGPPINAPRRIGTPDIGNPGQDQSSKGGAK
jgi:hypothetical protein